MNFCSATGNQGFPIPINGSLGPSDTAFTSLTKAPEIYSAFGTRSFHARLINQNITYYNTNYRNIIEEGNQGSSTLTYGPDRFTLNLIQIVAPLGGSPWPGAPVGTNVADAIFTFNNGSGGSPSSPRAIHLIVPLYSRESVADVSQTSPKAESYFQQTYYNTVNSENLETKPSIKSLAEIFKDFRSNPGYIQYSTCLQVRTSMNNRYQVRQANQVGLYFPSGWILPLQLIESIGGLTSSQRSYETFRLSRDSRFQAEVATSETPATNKDQWITSIANWSPYGQCYKSSAISVGSPEFSIRFAFIKKGLISFDQADGTVNRPLKTTFQYRCMPLDQAKDIDGENVLLDPATGKRRTLAETLNPSADSVQGQLLDLDINPDKQSNIEKFAIVIGVITAIALGLIILSFAVRVVLNRQGTSEGNEQAGFFARTLSAFKRSQPPAQPAA